MQSIAILFLMTSCLNLIVVAGDADTDSVPERSPDPLLDDAIANDNPNFDPLDIRNQYGIAAASLQDVSLKHGLTNNKPASAGNTEIVPLNSGYLDVPVNSQEVFAGPLLSKRFNEFVGKRGAPSEENILRSVDTLPDDDLSALGILVSSPERYLAEHQNKISNKATLEGKSITENLIRHLYNEHRNDNRLKREYEFVGKRNYDFVGKRNYDFVGKRNYDFVGKRNYDFLGKRSYDFMAKQQPFHFLYRKSNGLLSKQAPLEFFGKGTPYIDMPIAVSDTIPSGQSWLSPNVLYLHGLPESHLNAPAFDETSKRYSEFLGKRKRSEEDEEAGLSTSERLAALLQNNGLRKRLSRLLLNQRSLEHYPGFVGK